MAMSSLPESVREVVEHRIDRLGEHGREALTIAAVIGRSFDVELLAQLVEMSEARLLDELEAAVQASLLRESTEVVGRFDFEHALINHTLYQGLGRTRRARLHHLVAEAIEQLYGADSDEHLGELALHWRLATVSVDRPRAADYSLRAGRRALDSLAPSEAAKLFGDALDMLGSVASAARSEALIGLGEAQRQTGVPAYRETLLEAAGIAAELRDADLAARATLANNRGFGSSYGGVDLGRVAALERALELDDPPQPARHARLLALLAKELAFEPDRARRRALADEAIALARQAADPRTLADGARKLLLRHLGAGHARHAVGASSRAERAGRAGGGSARRVRRQAPGDEYGDRAGRFWAGRRGARACSGDRGADTAAVAEMERGLPRRRDDVHARRAGGRRAAGRTGAPAQRCPSSAV